MIAPVARYLNETTDRVPMNDWYFTSRPRQRGFQARSVVGGTFIKLLDDAAVWKKYADRSTLITGTWTPVPKPPIVTEVVPTAVKSPIEWSYTFQQPTGDWFSPSYDVSSWKKGMAGFGSGDAPGGTIRTEWTSPDIWIRREIDLPASALKGIQLFIQHDDDAQIYINGVLAANLDGANRYEPIELNKAGLAALKAGKNVIAVHCKDTGGDQYIDLGFVTVKQG